MRICSVEGCGKEHSGKGYCGKHLMRFKRHGDPLAYHRSVPYGGGSIDKDGYKVFTLRGKHTREHRKVMEQFLGRKLDFNELVHHKDGNKLNNSIENLEIVTRSEHIYKHPFPVFKTKRMMKNQ